MQNKNHLLRILWGAIVGAMLAIVLSFLFGTIIGLPSYGLGAFLLPFYFMGYVIFIVPVGMMFGAMYGAYLITTDNDKRKSKEEQSANLLSLIGMIGIPFFIVITITFFAYLNTDKISYVKHAAQWVMIDDAACDVQAVVLLLVEYEEAEYVCSELLLSYLETIDSNIVSIAYRVTSDFGEIRSYQLVEVGTIQVTWEDWSRLYVSCNTEAIQELDLPLCSDTHRQTTSPLYESTWIE